MNDILDDDGELQNNGNVPTKGQRQKEYRTLMKKKGFVCKQLWLPADRADELEQIVLDMRTQHVAEGKDTVTDEDDDLI